MLKKRVVKVLLPLLFSFCFVFSGFLSVDASAYASYDNIPLSLPLNLSIISSSGSALYTKSSQSPNTDNVYSFTNGGLSDVSFLAFHIASNQFNLPVNVDIFDYYIISSVYGNAVSIDDFTFLPNYIVVEANNHSNQGVPFTLSDYHLYHSDTYFQKGFSVSAKIDFSSISSIYGIYFYGPANSPTTLPANLNFEFSVIALPKDLAADAAQNAIVNAINSQTNHLSSDIGQASDDIQQSIEDQYSGDPETEFSVDDVISQHNEKMGVLSFGSDVMLQFLDMFQSANVGTAQLTLPGFNITVENVEYSVWPDYSFNFEQLNEWVPALMSVIRVMLPAFVWLMVLRYCINVFEKNFLSNGG